MKLSVVPVDNIYVGMRVLSDTSGHKGLVSAVLLDETEMWESEINIIWDDQTITRVWHYQLDKVTVLNTNLIATGCNIFSYCHFGISPWIVKS